MPDPNVDQPVGEQRAMPLTSSSHRRATFKTIVLIAVICLQVAIPLITLFQPPPQKLGFQMYSALGGVSAFIVDAQGIEKPVDDLEDIVAKYRPEIDWLRSLPEAICASDTDAVLVRVEQSGREREIACD